MAICPICRDTADVTETDYDELGVSCDGCGVFTITKSAVSHLDSNPAEKRTILSHWIRLACDQGGKPEIDQRQLQAILTERTLPTVSKQADDLLLWIGDELVRSGKADGLVTLQDHRRRLTSRVGAAPGPNSGSLMYLAHGLAQRGRILPEKIAFYSDPIGLTFAGWDRYEELKRAQFESRLAFMAMPFGENEPVNRVRLFEQFKDAVKRTGFELRRIIDNAPAGLIDNRLRVEIRKSRFMVCELTGANAGAYWEGGFAEGLGRPVLYTCEKSYFQNKRTHFDTNHCHTILWDESDVGPAVETLKATIRATLPDEAKMSDE